MVMYKQCQGRAGPGFNLAAPRVLPRVAFLVQRKQVGKQTMSLQALRLTNKVISAFSGHKQGKFVRKGFKIQSDTHDIIKPKVFIVHILVLLWLTCNPSSTGTRQQT